MLNGKSNWMGPRKIVFIGPECSGKSSLAKSTKKDLGIPCSEEYARIYAEALDRELVEDDAEKIMQGQLALEDEFLTENRKEKAVIFDTNILSSIIYSQWYYGFVPPGIEDELMMRDYDQYFLFAPELPWVPDRARGVDRREEQFEVFKKGLEDRGVPFQVLRGSQEARLHALKGYFERNEII